MLSNPRRPRNTASADNSWHHATSKASAFPPRRGGVIKTYSMVIEWLLMQRSPFGIEIEA
jgi:hypothetical protein